MGAAAVVAPVTATNRQSRGADRRTIMAGIRAGQGNRRAIPFRMGDQAGTVKRTLMEQPV
jgi:hypothetical protein